MSASCATCGHARPSDEPDALICHRYPPTVLVAGPYGERVVQIWPAMRPDDYCGEHTPPATPRRPEIPQTLAGERPPLGPRYPLTSR